MILIGTAVMLCSCQSVGESLRGTKKKNPVRVQTLTVCPTSSSSIRSYTGQVVPSRSVTLFAPYPGTVQTITVGKGSAVGGGDVVAVIRSQAVETSTSIARANLEQARDGYERASKVYESGSVTEVRMVEIKTLLAKAEASMQAALKAEEDCSVKAPFAGVVSEVYPSAGVEVAAAQRIMTITDMSDLRISISVHENDINAVRTGNSARVDIPALGLEGVPVRVKETSIVPEALTHSYSCVLVLEEALPGLMPGMFAKVRFEGGSDRCIVVPADAVQLDAQGKYVWLSESGTVAKRHIETGGFSGMGVVVKEGLKEGEKVIVKGYQKVSGGMKVVD